MRTLPFILVLLIYAPVVAAGFEDELLMSEALLTDVAIRSDLVGLEMARVRLEKLLKAPGADDPGRRARVFHDLALVEWNVAMSSSGDVERSKAAADRLKGRLESALELDSTRVESWALLNRGHYLRYLTGAASFDEVMGQMMTAHAQAKKLDASHPLVVFNEGIVRFYTPPETGGDAKAGLALIREAIEALSQADDPNGQYWHLMTTNFLAQALLGAGDPVAAREQIDRLLEIRPDYRLVRETLRPMTEPANTVTPKDLASRSWKRVAVDPEGDAERPGAPDATSLWFHHDGRTDWLWFRFDLAAGLDASAFGINLPFDVDLDQKTGMSWWGGNTAFKFDRLVTVWVAKTEDEGYLGAVGVGDVEGIEAGRFLNLGSENVAFEVDEGGGRIYAGFAREKLQAGTQLRLLGVVGSNTQWSDTVVDEGWIDINY